MNAEVFAQHIRCAHLLRGLCFKGSKPPVFPLPLVGPGPSPAGVSIHLMSGPEVQGQESNLWRQHMDAELGLLLYPQPPGPWGVSKKSRTHLEGLG